MGDVVGKPERQQHGFFQPLVRRPLAVGLLGDAQATGVELGDRASPPRRGLRRGADCGESSLRRSQAASIVACRLLIGSYASRPMRAKRAFYLLGCGDAPGGGPDCRARVANAQRG